MSASIKLYILYFMEKWYLENIEKPVRDLVYLLRNNGFNTECSCGHEMFIQCQYTLSEDIMSLHKMVYDFLYEKELPLNYEINITIKVVEGHQYPSLTIYLK